MGGKGVKPAKETGAHLHAGKFPPRHSPRKTRLAHLLEHFFHLRVLPEQVVDFLHAGAGTAGDALAAATASGFLLGPVPSAPRINHGPDALPLFFIDLTGAILDTPAC